MLASSLLNSNMYVPTFSGVPSQPACSDRPQSRPEQPTHHGGRRFTFGRHVFLRCHQLEAAELLEIHIDELVTQVERHKIGVFEVRRSAVVFHPPRYESD